MTLSPCQGTALDHAGEALVRCALHLDAHFWPGTARPSGVENPPRAAASAGACGFLRGVGEGAEAARLAGDKKRFPEAEAGAKTARYGWLEECFGTSHRSCLAIWICGPSRGSLSGTCSGQGTARGAPGRPRYQVPLVETLAATLERPLQVIVGVRGTSGVCTPALGDLGKQ